MTCRVDGLADTVDAGEGGGQDAPAALTFTVEEPGEGSDCGCEQPGIDRDDVGVAGATAVERLDEDVVAPGPDEAARSTVRNASTDVDAAGVVVTVALDPRLSLAAPAIATLVPSALTAPWSCTGTGTITCALDGPLAAGSGVDLDLPVVIALTASGPLTTTFSVAAETALVAPVSVERIVTITQPDPVFPTVPTVPSPGS